MSEAGCQRRPLTSWQWRGWQSYWYREELGKGNPLLSSRNFMFRKAFLNTIPQIDRNRGVALFSNKV